MKNQEMKYVITEATAIINNVDDLIKIAAIGKFALLPAYMEYGSESMAIEAAMNWSVNTIQVFDTIPLPVALKVRVERPAKLNRLAKTGRPTALKVEYFKTTCNTACYLNSLNEEAIYLYKQGDEVGAAEAAFKNTLGA